MRDKVQSPPKPGLKSEGVAVSLGDKRELVVPEQARTDRRYGEVVG
jgi:hypothetical protein